jgi:hypothetical protein
VTSGENAEEMIIWSESDAKVTAPEQLITKNELECKLNGVLSP